MKERKVVIGRSGFWVLTNRQTILQLLWSDLLEVVAFKQDRFTYDNLVFGFRIEEKDEYHLVDEEAAGFYDLENALVQHLEGFDQKWMEKVALPAFATNWHTVYGVPPKCEQ